jgi:imidazolonepropionase
VACYYFASKLHMKVDLLVKNIGQLVTCASTGKPKRGAAMRDVGLIEDGAVAIAGGKFVGVGTSEDVSREFEADEIIDAGGCVVCPGFVDPHTHVVFAGDRLDEFELKIKGADYLDILETGGGIISTVRKTREASFEELVEQSRRRLDKMLVCGTTTCEIKTGYGLDIQTELKMLAVIEQLDKTHVIDIVPTFLAAHAVPPEFKDDADGYVDLICSEMLPKAWDWSERSHFNGRVPCFADVFCEKNAFDLAQSRRVLETAKGLGFSLKAHVDEFTNLGGSRLAIELGAVSIDHLDTISDEEIALLARSDTVGIVTPTVNFNFGSSEFADARKLIDAGCAVALSTDYNPGSAPCPSQPMAMAIACRYQKMLPSEALNAATINAADAVGLGDRVGSIETGKWADMILVDTRDYRELAYEFGGMQVSRVIKRGEIIGQNHLR